MLSAIVQSATEQRSFRRENVDFNNLKPSDIISGAFASDGPKEKSGTQRQQAAIIKQLIEQHAQQSGVDPSELTGINVNEVSDPLEALNIVMVGMVTAIKGFQVLKETKNVTDEQFKAFMKNSKAIHKLWKAAVETLHEAHKAANGGHCDCDEHKEK